MHHAHHALVDGLAPLVVGEVLESADGAWSKRGDKRVELAVPPLAGLVEHPLNLVGVGGVGHQTERVRTSAGSEIVGRLVQHRFRPADDGDLRPVLGQTAGGRVTIPRPPPTTTAVASAKPRSMTVPWVLGAPQFARNPYYRAYSRRAEQWSDTFGSRH